MSRVFSVIQVSKNQSVKDSGRDVIDYLWSKPALAQEGCGHQGLRFSSSVQGRTYRVRTF